MDESRTRRMALPSVWPYPRSNGSSATLARLWPSCSTLIALGFSKLVCIQTSSQYPQLVTPVRLVKRLNRDASRFRDGFLEICTERLARIQLNDQGFVDVGAKLITVRHLLEDAFSLVGIHFHPGRHTHLCGQLQGFHNAVLLLRLFAHSHHVTRLHEVGSNVHGLAVHGNRLVRHQLTGFSAGRTETHAVHDVDEAWSRTWTCRRSSDGRSSGTGPCLHGGRVWPWGRGNVPLELPLCHLPQTIAGAA